MRKFKRKKLSSLYFWKIFLTFLKASTFYKKSSALWKNKIAKQKIYFFKKAHFNRSFLFLWKNEFFFVDVCSLVYFYVSTVFTFHQFASLVSALSSANANLFHFRTFFGSFLRQCIFVPTLPQLLVFLDLRMVCFFALKEQNYGLCLSLNVGNFLYSSHLTM